MKVLHIVSNLSMRNGIMSVLMSYYRNLRRENIQFSFLYYDETKESYQDEILLLGGAVYRLSRKKFLKEWTEFCEQYYGEFDILHNHELYLSFFLINSKKKLGNRIVVSHAHATKYSDSKIKSIRNRILSWPSVYISDSLFACSKMAGSSLFGKKFLVNGYVLNNAIDVKKFRFDENMRNIVRNELSIESNQFVIGHIGNFTPQKNHAMIVEIFRELLLINKDSVLILVGDGYLKNSVEQKVRELCIDDKVRFIGATSRVAEILNAIDVFLFPSLYEGLGIVLIEAQANGLSCVYSDVVPDEANILKACNVRLGLDEACEKWAKTITEMQTNRYVLTDEIERANYDVVEESKKLELLYIKILNNR